jgi:hypothetical protein
MSSWSEAGKRDGQASVEAAFLIPVILVCLMLLIQPSILLYDRIVMSSTAAQGCRLLATRTAGEGDTAYVESLKRALGAVPQQENFHVHDGGCSWKVEVDGNESSSEVGVSIATKVRLLPLFDWCLTAFGAADDGVITLSVEVREPAKPGWVLASGGVS